MKSSTKDIKERCVKGLSKTKTTNTNSINNLASLNLDFTRKIDSWQMNMNTEGTELKELYNRIRE